MVTWEQMAYLMEGIVVIAILYAFRVEIISKMYGIRFKRWIEIDTGRMGYTILNKSLNSCNILGMIRTVNRANIKFNVMYFVSDNVENLKVEDAKDKYQFYCNSEEYDTVYKNKLLETLMLALQNNWLMIILFAVILVAAIAGYSLYQDQQTTAKIDWLVWKVNQTYAP